MSVASRRPTRLLLVSALAAIGAIAWRVTHRPIQQVPPPEIVCAIPDVTIQTQQFATPPPGDPYPRPNTDARLVEAMLVDRPSVLPGCGTILWETTMVFHPLKSTGAGDLRVLVPCAEMPRPMYSADAGNAGILQAHHRYMLALREATDVPDGKNDLLWRAIRIDER